MFLCEFEDVSKYRRNIPMLFDASVDDIEVSNRYVLITPDGHVTDYFTLKTHQPQLFYNRYVFTVEGKFLDLYGKELELKDENGQEMKITRNDTVQYDDGNPIAVVQQKVLQQWMYVDARTGICKVVKRAGWPIAGMSLFKEDRKSQEKIMNMESGELVNEKYITRDDSGKITYVNAPNGQIYKASMFK